MLFVEGRSIPLWEPLLLGAGIGFIAGTIGVGGGFLITPALALLLRVPWPLAVGSSLAQAIGTSASALGRYWRAGKVDSRLAWVVIGGMVLGVKMGARGVVLLSNLGDWRLGPYRARPIELVLPLTFVVVLSGLGVMNWVEGSRSWKTFRRVEEIPRPWLQRLPCPPFIAFPASGISRVSLPGVVYSALLVGMMSGLMGVGGGILLVPLFLQGLGVQPHTALGTALMVTLLSSLAGTFAHGLHGNVHLGLVMSVLMTSTITSSLGARFTLGQRGATIRRLLAVLLFLTALWLLVRVWQSLHPTGL